MNLLIVDDDVHTVEAIWDSIDWPSIGIVETEIAYNVTQAKRVLRNKKIDIVVSDIEMPQRSGLDLLAWIRKQEMDVEFILLTCHEKFDYAANAIKLGAVEYLTKPYDANIMELSLRKVIAKIKKNRRLRESSRYEEWVLKNSRQEKLYFWLRMYSGIAKQSREWFRREIEARKLPINADAQYRLVMTKITDYELRLEDYGEELLNFSLENIHIEILSGHYDNDCVVRKNTESGLWLLSTVEDKPDVDLAAICRRLVDALAEAIKVKATCCLGDACSIEELPEKAVMLEKLIQQSVLFYGQSFSESEAVQSPLDDSQILDIEKMSEMLCQRDKVSLLNYIKEMLKLRTENKTLNERCLYLMKQEILQATYAYLLHAGIQATRLFYDETSVSFFNRALQSTLDMLRWANYMLERSFAYREEVAKASTLIERINAYVHEHYQENIGRNDLAEVFFLAPEYLSKLYHRKTGKYLKDYIREYRIERAKELLRNNEIRVSDVASAVGFDNFSYFTTVFKKYVGVTPNEYRQNAQ